MIFSKSMKIWQHFTHLGKVLHDLKEIVCDSTKLPVYSLTKSCAILTKYDAVLHNIEQFKMLRDFWGVLWNFARLKTILRDFSGFYGIFRDLTRSWAI